MLIPPKEIEYKIDEYPEGTLKLIQMKPNGSTLTIADAMLEVNPLNGGESWDCHSNGDIEDNARFTNKDAAVSYLWSLRPQPVNDLYSDVRVGVSNVDGVGVSEEEFAEKVFKLVVA